MSESNLAEVGPISLRAEAVVTRRRFVKASTTNDLACLQTAAGTDLGIGVALETTTAVDQQVPVQSYGVAQVECGAAVARGVNVTSDASGRGILAVTGNTVYGISLSATAAAGSTLMVLLHGGPNTSGPTTP